jgi:D-beta-D-heptose 7-phosphate kinase/D-beta-D-heptose 1-phosphate adenosyltransferase
MNKNIAIIGESCVDEYVYGTCDRVCPEAAALCFKHDSNKTTNIGMAGNTYNNMKTLDKESNIELITTQSEIIKRRFVDKRYNTIIFREDINDTCESIQLDKYDFSKYDCIVFSDYCKGFLSYSDIIDICKRKNNECITFMDTKKKLNDFVKYIDFVKINSKEFSMNILDLKNINSLCSLIVTTGENGANFYNKGNSQFINYPSKRIQLRDVCGAGDTFLAGLVVEYMRSRDIIESIKYANECSSRVVSQFGVVTP